MPRLRREWTSDSGDVVSSKTADYPETTMIGKLFYMLDDLLRVTLLDKQGRQTIYTRIEATYPATMVADGEIPEKTP